MREITLIELRQLLKMKDYRSVYVNGAYRTIDVLLNRYKLTHRFIVLTQNDYAIFLTTK